MLPEELLDLLEKAAARKGYFLHADREYCLETAKSLLYNKKKYGYMCCPCRLASYDKKQDADIICPCRYRDADIAEYGSCMCALYVSAEHRDDPEFFPVIDDRRNPEC